MQATATQTYTTNGYHAPEPARAPGPLERLRLAEADLVRRLDAITDAVDGVGTHLIAAAEARLAERLAALEARLEAAALRSAAMIDATAGRVMAFGAAADADRDAAARVSVDADPVPAEHREALAADPRNAGDYCPIEVPGSYPPPRPEVLEALQQQDAEDWQTAAEKGLSVEQVREDLKRSASQDCEAEQQPPPKVTGEDNKTYPARYATPAQQEERDADFLRRLENDTWPADAEAEDAAGKRMDEAAAGVAVPGPPPRKKQKARKRAG